MQFIQALITSISDLNRLADFYTMQWDNTSKLSSWLRDGGNGLIDRFAELADNFEHQKLIGLARGLDAMEVQSTLERIARDLIKQAPMLFALRRTRDQAGVEAPFVEEDVWNCSPGSAVAASAAGHLALTSVYQRQTPRRLKRSDFGDILHACYLPYVDVFRAEGFMASALQQREGARITVVVPQLTELVAAIEARLDE